MTKKEAEKEPEHWNGGGAIQRNIPKGYFTRSQVATEIGKSVDTVRRWHNDRIFRARKSKKFGNTRVWLYTRDDIEAMKVIASTLTAGAKPRPKETEEDSDD